MNKNSKRIFVRDLNANDVFSFPGSSEEHVVVSRKTEGNMTALMYRPFGQAAHIADYSHVSRVNMTTVDLITNDRHLFI